MRGITEAVSGKAKETNKNKHHVNKIMSPGMFWVGINSPAKHPTNLFSGKLQKKKRKKDFTSFSSRTPQTNLCCSMNVKQGAAEPLQLS